MKRLILIACTLLAGCVDGDPVAPSCEALTDSVTLTKPATGDTMAVSLTVIVC